MKQELLSLEAKAYHVLAKKVNDRKEKKRQEVKDENTWSVSKTKIK